MQAVLPVVARKQGLEGHYIQADGKPKPPKLQETIPEPVRLLNLCEVNNSTKRIVPHLGSWHVWVQVSLFAKLHSCGQCRHGRVWPESGCDSD